MRKKLALAAILIPIITIGVFVLKETVSFDSSNPYNQREVDPKLLKSMPPIAPSDLADFTQHSISPLTDADAGRAAIEFAASVLGADLLKRDQAKVNRVLDEGGGRTFVIGDDEGSEIVRVHMDRLGRMEIKRL